MRRTLLMARREFLTNIKRRSFLLIVFGMPLLIIGVQLLVGYFVVQQSETTGSLGQIGYVDLTPDQILDAAVDKPQEFRPFADEGQARAALLADEVGAYFVVPPDYIEQGIVHAYATTDVPRGIERQMTAFLTDNLLADWPAERADRLRDPMNLTLSTVEGEREIGEETSLGAILMPFLFAVVFMMSIFSTSGFLMQGVVEEKENRLIEILVTSVTPLQMLWGKILGLGALGLVQVIVWGVAGWLTLSRGDSLLPGLGDVSIPANMLQWAPIYLLLGYLLYGAMLAGIGAAVTSMQEGQQIAGVASLIAVAPMMGAATFFDNANGTFPTIASLVPVTAPVAMMLRLPLADVPAWQLALSVGLLALTTLFVVWLAAQIFRIGLLMYGKRLGLRSLWSALRQGRDVVPRRKGEVVR